MFLLFAGLSPAKTPAEGLKGFDGMRRGNLVGRTDKHAGDVEENPVSPKDILATALYLLGIDSESTFPDSEGRPRPITGTGRLRPELFG